MISAQDAVDDLYRIAVAERRATSTARLDVLADFCVQELTARGLKDVAKEASMSQTFDAFFGTLIEQVRIRNPNAVTT